MFRFIQFIRNWYAVSAYTHTPRAKEWVWAKSGHTPPPYKVRQWELERQDNLEWSWDFILNGGTRGELKDHWNLVVYFELMRHIASSEQD